MEAIWEDLRNNADAIPMQNWQKELLDNRRRAVAEGRERVLEWDEVKHSLGGKRG